MKNAVIAYMSPGGSTRHVGSVFGRTLADAGIEVYTVDLGLNLDETEAVTAQLAREQSCLFIGSPVYVNRPLPPVTEFIQQLRLDRKVPAVPFVTWGGASSGIALYDLGQALVTQGFEIIGAAKVLARHSMMWRFEQPLGEGRPNREDDQVIIDFTNQLVSRTEAGDSVPLAPTDLNYQSPEHFAQMQQTSLDSAKGHLPPKEVDRERCAQCGQCAEYCPVQAISLNPYPAFSDNCICCYLCVRNCPEEALVSDLSALENRIRERAATFGEQPSTAVFVQP